MYIDLLLLLLLAYSALSQTSPTICVSQGNCYKGSWISSDFGIKYASFQGIRYAQPPIGDLRFKPPQAYNYTARKGLIDVSKVSKFKCPQFSMFDEILIGQEDCLFLNIYVPEIAFNNPQTKLPVLFWIYGGGFVSGSNNFAEYNPQHFMDKEVVVVIINYRLGPLGFLCMGTEDVPGNVGLRDQSLALTWVQEYIAYFRGDPGSVTIFGESAGSLSVATHIISPLSEGLFHRAIVQSDTALTSSWGPITPKHALQYADKFAKALGCDKEDDILTCLQGQEIANILSLTDLMEGAIVWMAVSDIDFTSEPFLPGNPDQLMSDGQFNKEIQVMLGNNADEGMVYFVEPLLDPNQWDNYRNNFDKMFPALLFNIANKSDITAEDIKRAHKLVEYYIGSVDNMNEEHAQGLFNMFTDAEQLFPNYRTSNDLVKHGVTVYQYILTYEGEYSVTQLFGLDHIGVCHADDLIYLWESFYGFGPLNDDDTLVREIMTTAWTNFATYGDPTPPDSGLSWTPQVPNSDYQYWNISGSAPVMSTSQEIQDRMAFWEQVLFQNIKTINPIISIIPSN